MSKIVVAYDGSDLSKKALKRGIQLAKMDKSAEINVITVVSRTIATIYSYGAADPVHETNVQTAREIMDEAEEMLMPLPNKKETYILKGPPAQTIESFAEENNADIIVMGSRGLGGLKELFLGSVSHHVVQKANCEVLIVK